MKKSLLLALLLAVSSCNKQSSFARNGTIYRSIDGQQKITIQSPDELELQKQSVNLICKYTIDDDTLRVVATMNGTAQALYYKITPEGVRANDNTVLFSPIAYTQAMESAQNAVRLSQEQRKARNARAASALAEAEKETRDVGTFDLKASGWTKATITDVSVKLTGAGRPPVALKFTQMDRTTIASGGAAGSEGVVFIYPRTGSPYDLSCPTLSFTKRLYTDLKIAYGEWQSKFPDFAHALIEN